ncbi:hypothetical protein [Helicobacter sp. 10-6591]|uniref:hypothetical protein n=1 Tax=Helicobacter sp. 10-6591 TaxID=2004998 RepID=UPI000DCC6265|nr:hypothetical protein [Helicobacter sp. 10-6591]MCI7484360.1 hypothetical protein [Helicobacter sp.]RAX55451.1 hypothetical protein CCY97_04075 [Helicobacter sp. 10-6591]
MSYIPTQSLKNSFDSLSKETLFFEIYKTISAYFETQKNPKVFLFYLFLFEIRLDKNNSKVFFNILHATYKYDICEKTIKSYLKQLEELKLIKFNYKNKQLYFIEILDYKQSLIFTQENPQSNPSADLPNRFYKDIALIIKNIARDFNKQTKKINIDGEQYKLIAPSSRIHKLQHVVLEFESLKDSQMLTGLTYENLTNKSLPPLNNPFHQRIIKANLKKSLYAIAS